MFGLIQALLLTFYMLVESRDIRSFFCVCFTPSAQPCRIDQRQGHAESERVARWPTDSVDDHRPDVVDRPVGDGRPYYYVLALISAIGDDSDGWPDPVRHSGNPRRRLRLSRSGHRCRGLLHPPAAAREHGARAEDHGLRQVGLSAVNVIIALGIGSQLLGVVGAILSVPTAAIVQVLFGELVARDE